MGTEKVTYGLLTAAWMSSDATLLDNGGAGSQPLAMLGNENEYAVHFEGAQRSLAAGRSNSLALPWPSQKGQVFWYYYLKKTVNGRVGGHLAWKKITPFRVQVPLHITAVLPNHPNIVLNANVEGFLYPHAVAGLVTLSWIAETTIPEFEDLAISLRRDPVFIPQWQPAPAGDIFQNASWPSNTQSPVSLGTIGLQLLKLLRTTVFGPGPAGGNLTDRSPFTILSVLGGEGVDLTGTPEDNGEIQCMLHAITAWEHVPDGATPLQLSSEVSLGLGKLAGPADLLYGAKRGRAVWYPSKFLRWDQPNYKLRCYHRNLMFASMQTEAMYGYAFELAQRRAANATITHEQHTLARRAAATLGLLYSAHHDTYRSQSPHRQIDDNQWVDEINAMRRFAGMRPLH